MQTTARPDSGLRRARRHGSRGRRRAGLSDTVTAYWSRFAATGQMNGHDIPAWKPFTTRATYIQRLASDRIGPTDFAADHHHAFREVLTPSQ